MSTSLNRGRLRRPGRGPETEEKAVKTDSTNRLTHRNSDTPRLFIDFPVVRVVGTLPICYPPAQHEMDLRF